jgi:hypothetical protein
MNPVVDYIVVISGKLLYFISLPHFSTYQLNIWTPSKRTNNLSSITIITELNNHGTSQISEEEKDQVVTIYTKAEVLLFLLYFLIWN